MLDFLRNNNDHVIIFIGAVLDQELLKEIVEIVKNAKLENRFIIHDIIEHNEFQILLKEVQLVINTSITEGMSNVIMESMLNGIPVLARSNEGNLKLIKHNYNGFIFSTKEEFSTELNNFYKNKEKDRDAKYENGKDCSSDSVSLTEIIKNGKKSIKDSFGYQAEKTKYKDFLEKTFNKIYIPFEFKNHKFQLYFPDIIHPYSTENNEIFNVFFIL